ncbi:MAG: hypothetical protein RIF33_02450 [Cyclobacteriaceae bacterium]
MSTTELKKQLHEHIENADESLLTLVHGIFESQMNKGDWWDELTQEAKDSIEIGIAQLDRGEGIPHEEVMKAIREKYLDS